MRRVDYHALHIILVRCIIPMVVIFAAAGSVMAEDVPFHPRYDGVKIRKPRKKTPSAPSLVAEPQAIFSFKRYSANLENLCNLLEQDGRQVRVYEIARERLRDAAISKSYRAFLKELIINCKPKLAVKQTPAADKTPQPSPQAKTPRRYPSTELIDALSRLSTIMYERDPGTGGTFEAARCWGDTLRVGAATPGERDYFGIFAEYLLSAWQGRPQAPLESTKPSKSDVHELYQ